MTKKEIVKAIAEKYDQSQVLVKDIVQETFNLIIDTLVKEGRIELRNFGVFEVKVRKARRARNPKTDQEVLVGPKKVVTFQPGKIMEERARDAEKVVEARKGRTDETDETEDEDDLPIPPDVEEFAAVGTEATEPTADEAVPAAGPKKPR